MRRSQKLLPIRSQGNQDGIVIDDGIERRLDTSIILRDATNFAREHRGEQNRADPKDSYTGAPGDAHHGWTTVTTPCAVQLVHPVQE